MLYIVSRSYEKLEKKVQLTQKIRACHQVHEDSSDHL